MNLVRRISAAAMIAAVPFSPSIGQTSDTPAAGEQRKAKRVVCRRTQITGNLVAKRVCKSESAWRAQSRNAVDSAQRLVDQGTVNSCGELVPGVCSAASESLRGPGSTPF